MYDILSLKQTIIKLRMPLHNSPLWLLRHNSPLYILNILKDIFHQILEPCFFIFFLLLVWADLIA